MIFSLSQALLQFCMILGEILTARIFNILIEIVNCSGDEAANEAYNFSVLGLCMTINWSINQVKGDITIVTHFSHVSDKNYVHSFGTTSRSWTNLSQCTVRKCKPALQIMTNFHQKFDHLNKENFHHFLSIFKRVLKTKVF